MRTFFKKCIVAVLTWEARAVLHKYKPRIVAVTGSVGKTSTKDAIYAVLAPHVFVRKSEKSFNSEIGIPLSILGRPNAWHNPLRWLETIIDGLVLILFRHEYPAWLVLEVGADRPGDISTVAKWLPVDIVMMTRLPDVPVHVEFFDSPEEVIREKASLLTALTSTGTFVVNADDPVVLGLSDRVPGQAVTYGFSLGAGTRGSEVHLVTDSAGMPIGLSAQVSYEDTGEQVELRMLGSIGVHAFSPLLAACAVGRVLGFSLIESVRALSAHVPPPGRMRLLPGLKSSTLIDDTYNASPAATMAALDTLTLMGKGHRSIVAIADMLELGRFSVEQHKRIGNRAAEVTDVLVTVGFRARDIAEGALNAGMPESTIQQFEDALKAGKYIEDILQPGDVVLLKGSQSMRMEKAVEEIMLEPERAEELLVRQEREWKKRS